ncbi:MAG: DUF1499 domain-containing protein [Anaerolineae bacterium]|nr:DUF1499 domain-containing protein [Anaerolineae bacterium]
MNTLGNVVLVSALIVGGAVLGFFLLRLMVSAISPRPDNLGVQNGKLAPCPSYPNCVSSQAADEVHAVEPIPYATTLENARARILRIVSVLPRSTIVTADDDYVHVEFRTSGVSHIDDVEFYFDEETDLIQIRSAARLPYYDFMVNRRRAELIRDAFLLE